MTNRLLIRTETKTRPGSVREQRAPRILVLGIIGLVGVVGLGLLAVPILIGTNAFFAASAGCSGQQTGTAGQAGSAKAKSIPANYLFWYKKVGQQYGVPWTILAGIGTVESDNGQTTLPGVHSGPNAFGAAGPMQIGIGGAAGNTWGGAAGPPGQPGGQRRRHRRGRRPSRTSTTPPTRSRARPSTCSSSRCRPTRRRRSSPTTTCSPTCRACCTTRASTRRELSPWSPRKCRRAVRRPAAPRRPGACPPSRRRTQAVATAIAFAEQQLGKPYLWGGTGPDAFDCSGLVMMAYRAAGIDIERTSEAQWATRAAGACLPGAAGGPGVLRRLGRHHHVSGARRPGDREREDDRGVRDGLPDPRRQLRQPRGDRLHPTLGQGRNQPPQPRRPRLRRPACQPRAPPSLPPHEPLVDRFGGFSTRMCGWRYTVRKE